MGNECKSIQNHPLASDFSVIQPIDHPAMGQILYLKSESMHFEKAIKRISYGRDASGVERFRERVELMKECQSVSTLIKIYDYEVIEANSEGAVLWRNIPNQANCQHLEYPFILMHFQYLPPESTLSHILQARLSSLQKNQRRFGNELTGKARAIKLFDYLQIDTLQSQERQLVNCFYQEIEVVRMIDHLVGALFFLHHYDIPHGATRPDCVLVDAEGKYLLVDKELFKRTTNYTEALTSLRKNNKQNQFQFIAPEWILDLNEGCQSTFCDNEKSDIFCISLIALQMCLLDSEQLLYSYDFNSMNITFNENIIQKWMTQVRNRYSPQFCQLLEEMLIVVPGERIDFAELIDRLNPILGQNLMTIKELYNPTQNLPQKERGNYLSRPESKENIESPKEVSFLKANLINMEERFQRIMNNRTLLLHRPANEKTLREEQQKILSKLRQIQISKSGFQSTTARKNNPELQSPMVNNFQLSQSKKPEAQYHYQPESSNRDSSKNKQGKRYVSGKELQAIVWKEYENIKSKRSP